MNDLDIQADVSETNRQENKQKLEAIIYIDNDLIQFIVKAQQQGFNCLDLSKRSIKECPVQLLEFTSLQYLYLEGNQLTQLPNDLFNRLLNIKWLDLRNNQITSIPSYGLAKHKSLQYLLLSGNHLRTLPYELGKVKTLSALNLDGNPLDYPLVEIIKQGIKAIQQYLRNKLDQSSSSSSDDDQQPTPRVSHQPLIYPRKTKSETDYYDTFPPNLLPPHLQSCIQYKRMSYSATRPSSKMRSRPQSEMKLPQVKTKINNSETDVYAATEQPLMHLKHRDKEQIQELRRKNIIRTRDYEEPMVQTPFHFDPRYLSTMSKDQQNINRQSHSSESILRDDEERRARDRKIQDRIHQITDKMLKRRLEARGSAFQEKRQVKLELRQLHRLETQGKPHQSAPIDPHFKIFTRKKL